jgi:hypothetical protein
MVDRKARKSTPSWIIKLKLEVWVPIVISLTSLCIAFDTHGLYKAQVAADARRDAEERRRSDAQNTPHVSVGADSDTDDKINGLQIENDSSVSARLKKITYYVDGKPFDDIEDVIDYGKLGDVGYFEFNDDDTLAAGGQQWLLSRSTKTRTKDLDRFNEFVEDHIAVKVEVCSDVTQKCETQCSDEGKCK